ncbi:MAG: helix-turn-helix domain-containing protein [Candidatus Entotheonellia bacterium]
MRRLEVAKCLRQGFRQCDIAEALGMHPATICRDVVAIYAAGARHPMLP